MQKSIVSERSVKAKAKHQCCECHKDIPVGDEYVESQVELKNTRSLEFKTCQTCTDLRQVLINPRHGIPPYGEMWPWANEIGTTVTIAG